MRQKKRITNKTVVLTAVAGSLLVMAMVMTASLWYSRQTADATDEAVSAVSLFYLEAMADRRAKTITNLISNSFDQMEKAVAYIAEDSPDSQEELRKKIGDIKSLLGITRFALVDERDIVYTQYTTYTGRSRHDFLSEENLRDRNISTTSLYGSARQLCLVIPTENLSLMGSRFKACFIEYDINDIVDLLAFDDQGRTSYALYSKTGVNLSGTQLGPVIKDQNLFDAIKGGVPEKVWKENCDHFANETGGNITYTSGEVTQTLFYVPIQGTGWEMAVLIRESVIHDQFRDIRERNLETSRNLILFTLLAVAVLGGILFLQIRRISKDKLEKERETSRAFEQMANTDSLTGVRNKHAYSEYEEAINRQIAAGTLQKLAVVVGDINGLKYINDTKGHAAGDRLIKDASALICENFAHGAVFRIGGDEFVIILQGNGYDTMQEAVDAMNRRAEANIKEQAVVVSIGFSVLGQGDQKLRDVFERADKMMYDRKKELKEMGALSGRG